MLQFKVAPSECLGLPSARAHFSVLLGVRLQKQAGSRGVRAGPWPPPAALQTVRLALPQYRRRFQHRLSLRDGRSPRQLLDPAPHGRPVHKDVTDRSFEDAIQLWGETLMLYHKNNVLTTTHKIIWVAIIFCIISLKLTHVRRVA